MKPQAAEEIVVAFVESINAADLEGIAARTAPSYTFVDMEGEVHLIEGRTAVEASWDEYLTAYPDYTILVQSVLRSGDGVAIVGQTEGSHLPRDIEREELVLWVAELENGLISGWRIYSTLMCGDAPP
ncbi:MAG: nuclear transport factor 2 family protein [Candidatus Bipolaricaulota bacterium]|nr:MAG: nuclear transport factor 2 family protein [Candidatus Bipolaricaulota bacterium]